MTVINNEKMKQQANAHKQAQGKEAPEGRAEKNDRYTIKDEQGNYIDRYYSQDELNETLEVLKQSDTSLVSEFEALSTFEQRQVFNGFKDEAQSIVEEVEALEGDLYTDEGKKAEINKRLNQLAVDKKKEAADLESDYKERHNELVNKMDKQLNTKDDLTDIEIAEINLRSSELQGNIKGKLYSINDTRNLEHEFNTLVNAAKEDKGLSRFLENNYYLFLDKVQSLDTGEMDKARAIQKITKLAESVKASNYTDKERALIQVKRVVDKKSYNLHDNRLIDKHLQTYLRKV